MRGVDARAIYPVLFLAALGPVPLAAQESVTFDQASRQAVGDWSVECIEGIDPTPGACQLYQRVLTQDVNVAAMVTAIAWSPSESALRLQVSLPLGTDLRSQPVMRIDGEVFGTFSWSRCLARGCMVEALLSRELVSRLTQGETASITVVHPDGGGIEIPLSLTGISSGLEIIMPQAAPSDTVNDEGE